MEAIIEGLNQVIEIIWSSVLGMDIEEIEKDSLEIEKGTVFLTGSVEFTGGWEGAVSIHCSMALASTISATMFGSDPENVSSDEVKDSLGELANIAAGNIKPLLPATCSLTMPSVIEGTDYKMTYRGSKSIGELHFQCDGHPVSIQLMERIE